MKIPKRLWLPKDIFLNFPAMMFLGVSIFLSYSENMQHIWLTFKGLGFLVVGTILSGLLVGTCINSFHRRYSMHVLHNDADQLSGKDSVTETSMKKIRIAGTIVMLIQVLVIYYCVEFSFNYFFKGH